MWHAAFSQAQRTASSVWQLMFLQSDGRVSSMSISEAQRGGYSLVAGAQRVALRSPYKQPHAELSTVEGVPVEVLRVSLFFKKKLTVMMIDVSMACTVNSGSFDGARLLWDVPRVMTPLVDEGAVFESRTLGLGLEGVLLDERTATTKGFSVVKRGPLIQIGVPFGAEGGYRKTVSDDRVFSVYLGNIPADVTMEDVHINGNQMEMTQSTKGGFSIRPVLHANGSRAYELRLPFQNPAVRWTYVGQGVVQYSIDVNYTLTIVPQKDSYYHLTTTLEIPVFSVGYTYDDVTLSNFYGTFRLLLRDSKTLEVQTSTSKRCIFKTEDMIVCSADGTMAVVTTPTSTWPSVHPDTTTLLDPSCKPRETDAARVLFVFKLDSCGTRALVSGNIPSNKVNQAGGVLPLSGHWPRPKPGPSHFITVPGAPNKLLSVSQKLTNSHLSPSQIIGTQQVPGSVSQKKNQQVFGFSEPPPHGPRYQQSPDKSAQLSNPRPRSFNFVQAREENSGLTNKNWLWA
ncbi:hypothetical protein FQN60_007020 [Etheostoma spectabile]|uniref:Uncharacterized protein n=1 Tax=Etheostoma spectabile TaxID=54343 RepID=A0A5J5C8J8_9PERO|nr:hypothetical protein FQN60_007020 [Etheostoma spectabile]